jgi:Flp pilus assembly protein TadG
MQVAKLTSRINDQSGATAVLVAIMLMAMLGFVALAVDISHLFVADNELRNAADAGALAGARWLYNNDGTQVNTAANQIANDAAIANQSEKTPVEVNWTSGNTGDVQRGHWRFATQTFTANDSTAPVALWGVTDDELDADPNFINAVRVVTRREATPVVSFFAGLFGFDSFQRSATAVSYIGFAGTLRPGDVDQPIAICEDSVKQGDEYNCNIGRMINSGSNLETSQTGGWTSFNQENPCSGGTNAQEVRGLVCSGGNPDVVTLGGDIATNGGEIQTAFQKLFDCWVANSQNKTQPWNLTLPVVTCQDNNVGTCEEVVGAVNLSIVWINDGNDPQFDNLPEQMGTWTADANHSGLDSWNDFAGAFKLQNVNGDSAPYAKKSIYFLPDCSPHDLAGVSGGQNFGVLARIPVLVN